jgi:hypothetical protein
VFFFDLEPTGSFSSYAALLNQSGTDAPVATVISNGLGAVVWTRISPGEYRGTLAGAFPAGKTLVFVTNSTGGVVAGSRFDNDTIVIVTSGDSILVNASVKIEVYP